MRTSLATLMIAAALLTAGPAVAAPSAAPSAKTSATPKNAKPLPSSHKAWGDAVTYLEKAKKTLQSDKSKDTNNRKAKALDHIQKAMEELRAGTQGDKH